MPNKKKKSKQTKSRKAAKKHGNPKKKTRLAAKSKRSKKVGNKRRLHHRSRRRVRGRAASGELVALEQPSGLGAGSGGQSGDIQKLSGVAEADSESVQELLEEGQSFEAEVISGVENAPDPDEAEVTTREVPEDDVPKEYLDDDDAGPEREGSR